jgi:hypothetical protein
MGNGRMAWQAKTQVKSIGYIYSVNISNTLIKHNGMDTLKIKQVKRPKEIPQHTWEELI